MPSNKIDMDVFEDARFGKVDKSSSCISPSKAEGLVLKQLSIGW
jgi:hypothetical protein